MTHARGFTTIQIFAAIAILGILAGMGYMVKSYIDGVDQKAFARGIAEEKARWQGREVAELAQANRTIAFLNTAYRDLEAAFAVKINGLSAKHEEEKRNAEKRHDADVAAVRDGFRLRDVAGSPAARKDGGGGAPATSIAATGQPDAAGRAELSEAATGFLLAEANRADAIAVKLGEVQDLLTLYWQSCGGEKKGPPEGKPASPGGSQVVLLMPAE